MATDPNPLDQLRASLQDALAKGDLPKARALMRAWEKAWIRSGEGSPTRSNAPGALATSPLLAELDADELRALLHETQIRHLAPGEVLVEEGQPGTSVYAIAYGAVDVFRTLGGTRHVLATLGPGDFLGELALVAGVPRLATVQAVEACGVVELTRDRLHDLGRRHPRVEEVLQRQYKQRLLANVLSASAVLRALDASDGEALVAGLIVEVVEPGIRLVTQGKPGTGFSVLLRGRCHVDGVGANGPFQVPDLTEGDVFGEISLVRDIDATANVTSAERSVVLMLPRSAFNAIVLGSPKAKAAVLALVDDRLGRVHGLGASVV
jgi:cAMP-dependent protein kinase regulator